MDEAVENGIGQRGITDGLVPEFDRHLRSDHRRTVVVAIDEEVAAIGVLPLRAHQRFELCRHLCETGYSHVYFGSRYWIEDSDYRRIWRRRFGLLSLTWCRSDELRWKKRLAMRFAW